ncbi:hypothetical protein NW739_00225 [Mycoplasmopsis felis]|uniref:hypothetical protein n=1 Tax=Mycoplasmopsis felis TaxID=33923 RepID=UPI0021E09023|nr:hypothetical protein [Mycoplasmopsis felis]MCU9939275.1 hypothetical protein [Mycoplasmopsis felis]WAM01601.1 hypothetical protein NWE60_03350 [Mycoplasmopsis felis]
MSGVWIRAIISFVSCFACAISVLFFTDLTAFKSVAFCNSSLKVSWFSVLSALIWVNTFCFSFSNNSSAFSWAASNCAYVWWASGGSGRLCAWTSVSPFNLLIEFCAWALAWDNKAVVSETTLILSVTETVVSKLTLSINDCNWGWFLDGSPSTPNNLVNSLFTNSWVFAKTWFWISLISWILDAFNNLSLSSLTALSSSGLAKASKVSMFALISFNLLLKTVCASFFNVSNSSIVIFWLFNLSTKDVFSVEPIVLLTTAWTSAILASIICWACCW